MTISDRRWLDVELRHIDLSYDGHPVLRDLAWRVRPGERWVLAGGNGAGKTQLLKMLAGDVWPTPPDDFAAKPAIRRYRWKGGLQDLAGGVKDEIAYLGPERQDRYERYDWNFPAAVVVGTGVQRADIPAGPLTASGQARVAQLLHRLQIDHLAGRPFLTLSYGERRLVLLARALAWRPALLLLDEITNGLDEVNRARFQAWLRASTRSAMPWVLTTHRAEDVPPSATHLAVLRDGVLLRRGRLTPKALAGAFREAGATPLAAGQVAAAPKARKKPEVLLQMRRADVHLEDAHLLHRIDLTVHAGDCWVIHGRNGAGKSTLLRTLWGDYPVAVGGTLHRAGIGEDEGIPEWRQRVGYITPQLQADHPQQEQVLDVVGSGLHASIGLNQPLTSAEKRKSLRALADFGLQDLAARTLRQLSYGQLRRVLFARAWVTRPRLLLLDEPFAGVDTATREELLRRLHELQTQGVTLVLVSHHRNEWPPGTTHELELESGRVRYAGPRRA
ncbi:MAG: hypothetical protein RL026_1941 [Pseudomonadota bacterium]